MKEFARRKITFTAVKVNESCNLMIDVMKKSYDSCGMQLVVTDLAKACSTKSKADVTKDFIEAASYILSVAVGDGGPAQPKQLKGEPLWDIKQLAEL